MKKKTLCALLLWCTSTTHTSPNALLLEAAKQGNAPEVEHLLNEGVDINIAEAYTGHTPLILACIHRHGATAKVLLTHKADTELIDQADMTALHHTARNGDTTIARLLLNHNAHVDYTAEKDKTTALMWATIENHPRTASLLLRRGAHVNAKNYHGLTALMFACIHNNLGIAQILLQYGANVHIRKFGNRGPTAITFVNDNPALVDLLVTHGAKKQAVLVECLRK